MNLMSRVLIVMSLSTSFLAIPSQAELQVVVHGSRARIERDVQGDSIGFRKCVDSNCTAWKGFFTLHDLRIQGKIENREASDLAAWYGTLLSGASGVAGLIADEVGATLTVGKALTASAGAHVALSNQVKGMGFFEEMRQAKVTSEDWLTGSNAEMWSSGIASADERIDLHWKSLCRVLEKLKKNLYARSRK